MVFQRLSLGTGGIFARDAAGVAGRGPQWGDPRPFCATDDELAELVALTPGIPGFATAGPRPASWVQRQVRAAHAAAQGAAHAAAQGAVQEELDFEAVARLLPVREVATRARTRADHHGAPALGAQLDDGSAQALAPEAASVQILITDGLSAGAVHANLPALLPVLTDGLAGRGIATGTPLVARYGRVKLAEAVASRLGAALVLCLIGERPGGDAQASRSLSAYLVYRLGDPGTQRLAAAFGGNPDVAFETTVVSNIHAGGLPPLEAGAVLVERITDILTRKAAGNRLEALRDGRG